MEIAKRWPSGTGLGVITFISFFLVSNIGLLLLFFGFGGRLDALFLNPSLQASFLKTLILGGIFAWPLFFRPSLRLTIIAAFFAWLPVYSCVIFPIATICGPVGIGTSVYSFFAISILLTFALRQFSLFNATMSGIILGIFGSYFSSFAERLFFTAFQNNASIFEKTINVSTVLFLGIFLLASELFISRKNKIFAILFPAFILFIAGVFYVSSFGGSSKSVQEAVQKIDQSVAGSTSTTKVFSIPATIQSPFSYVFSPDGEKIAYEGYKNGGSVVSVNDAEGKSFYGTFNIPKDAFSLDSKRFGYTAMQAPDGKQYTFVDDKKYGPYDESTRPTFSPDGKRFGFTFRRNGESYVIINEQQYGPYGFAWPPIFGSDNHYAYLVSDGGLKNGPNYLIIDGVAGKKYQSIGAVLISPDGTQNAYVADTKNGQILVFNGREIKLSYSIRDLLFTPDNKLIYGAIRPDYSSYVVIDGVEHVFAKKGEREDPMAVSADSKKIAYRYMHANPYSESVIVGNIEGTQVFFEGSSDRYTSVRNIVLNKNGSRVVFVGVHSDNKKYLVVNDREYGPYDEIGMPKFSEDEKSVIVGALLGKDFYKVVQSVE